MERFKVFDVLHHEHLSLVSLSLADPASLPELFKRLEEKEIKIKFLVSHHENHGTLHLTFCATRSRHICWPGARISARFRRCSAMRTSRLLRSTRTSAGITFGRCTSGITRVANRDHKFSVPGRFAQLIAQRPGSRYPLLDVDV